MKLSQHDTYSSCKAALIALTATCFKTGDVRIKQFRDDLEQYLQTEYLGNKVDELEPLEDTEESEVNEYEE